jgi:hypothetical protein
MEANELRIGNLVLTNNLEYRASDAGKIAHVVAIDSEKVHEELKGTATICHLDSEWGDTYGQWFVHLKPIPLTEEWLLKFAFYQMPHNTIQNSFMKNIGRGRVISVGCVGTPNEMVFITDENGEKVENIITARNFDYDGKTYVHQLQNIYFALTGQELTINK